MLEVHVVDRVGERLLDPERLRGAEARPVLDVAPLAAVVPVHRRDLVLVRARAGGDRRRAHRRHRRERRDAVVDVVAALHQRLSVGARPLDDRPLEHRGLHRVDDDEDELLGHRRMRKPAYFSPARRRLPSSSQASAAMHEDRQRREQDREPGGGEAGALAVDRQRRLRLGVQPRCARARTATAPREAERGRSAPATTPGTIAWSLSASDPAPTSAPSATATASSAHTTGAGSRPAARRSARARSRRPRRRCRNRHSSRNAKSVPSKSSPTSADASAPTSSDRQERPDADRRRRSRPLAGDRARSPRQRATIASGWAATTHRSAPGARDLERYAGLFARRTQAMKSSAMRDLMAVTARPEIISLAGGLPDTSHVPGRGLRRADGARGGRRLARARSSTGRPRGSRRSRSASSR